MFCTYIFLMGIFLSYHWLHCALFSAQPEKIRYWQGLRLKETIWVTNYQSSEVSYRGNAIGWQKFGYQLIGGWGWSPWQVSYSATDSIFVPPHVITTLHSFFPLAHSAQKPKKEDMPQASFCQVQPKLLIIFPNCSSSEKPHSPVNITASTVCRMRITPAQTICS